MKINLILLLAAGFANPASAAVLTQFISTDVPSGNAPTPANDWVDGINVSPIAIRGALTKPVASAAFGGWASTPSLLDYVGFGISADPGQLLKIDSINHGIGSSSATAHRMGSFTFGYRIDPDGSGPAAYGDWVMGNTLVFGDADYAALGSTATRVWDLDIETTGSVEFGFFGTANATGGGRLNIMGTGSLIVNGSVAPIPEPSAAALGLLGSLVFFRRRR